LSHPRLFQASVEARPQAMAPSSSEAVRINGEAVGRTWWTKTNVLLTALTIMGTTGVWQLSLGEGALTQYRSRHLTALSNSSNSMSETKQCCNLNRHARRICVTMDSTVIGRRRLYVQFWGSGVAVATFNSMTAGQTACHEPSGALGTFFPGNTPLYCHWLSASHLHRLNLCSSNSPVTNTGARFLFQYNPNSDFQANYICNRNDCRELSRQRIE